MGKSLLIVDDSATMRKIIMRSVRMSGIQFDTTEEAGNGVEALEKLNSASVDVILCDVNMPEMNGDETFDCLQKINPQLPVLLSSGYALDGQAAEVIRKGCAGFLQKPFNITALSKQIRLVLDR